ncbi:MAG TPA: polyketide synthase dehydratase domain-containing protein, partial [Mycobacterium sp.]|nr:polyketide synthase dehydratase domain-containing protein [Mycobacterium sp.]
GPSSVVVSGDEQAVTAIADQLRARGRRVHQLAVSHAFHLPLMEPMIGEFTSAARELAVHPVTIPVISNVTGELAGADFATADYWIRHIRAAVRFADSIRHASAAGASRFIEVGPGGGLTSSIEESLAEADVVSVPLLRKDRPEPNSLMTGVAQAFVSGVGVDWRATLPGASFVELPTYAFERRRFWLSADETTVDAAGLGLAASEHALLGAVVELPSTGGVLLTGRLSSAAQGWLADHAVGGVVIFPGSGFVELAIRAGDEVGCTVVDELMLAAPLVIPATGSVSMQVVVGGADESGNRAVSIYSRGDAHSGWTLHAEGVVRPGAAEPGADMTSWPPVGATPVDIDGLYDRLAARGYGYGPAFQGLTAMWRRGDDIFADVSLPDDAGVSPAGFGVHPAVLDAALHAVIVAGEADHDSKNGVLVPFSWQGVSLHAAGASSVRARIAPSGPSSVSVELADALGLPVLSVASMVARPVTRQQLMAAVSGSGPDRIFEVVWSPAAPGSHAETASYDVFESQPADHDPLASTYARIHDALAAVQAWLAQNDSGLLLVSTRGAVALPGEDVADLAGAAVWGLVRAAQTEHPGRIVLVDSDASLNDTTIAQVLAVGEPQALVRKETVYTGRVRGSRAVDALLVPPADEAWRLGMSSKGTFENLVLEPIPDARAPLQPGQVRVAVRTMPANFRDVMIALGLYPDEDAVMGVEASGVVIETAPDVSRFAVGDRVTGLFPEGTGSMSITDARLLMEIPAGWSYAEAATAPVVFTTAYYALTTLADVKPGQRILVHAGAGGVGMAAVQLARHFGLEVFATASRGKWDTLRAMGFDDDHLGDSRTLDFEDKFRAVTAGRGVDVVLDSLAGEFVDASLRLVAAGGV